MIIDSFIIEGFSNIEHIRLDVGEINALIAPNGYGKSKQPDCITMWNVEKYFNMARHVKMCCFPNETFCFHVRNKKFLM